MEKTLGAVLVGLEMVLFGYGSGLVLRGTCTGIV